jgi:hypothetical protein
VVSHLTVGFVSKIDISNTVLYQDTTVVVYSKSTKVWVPARGSHEAFEIGCSLNSKIVK